MFTSATFSKAGGGFLPLQRLDRAQTAFLVIVSLVDLVRSLSRGSSISASDPSELLLKHSGAEDWLTSTVEEGCCSSARSPCTLRCPLRCCPRPTQPSEYKQTTVTDTCHNKDKIQHLRHSEGHLLLNVLKVRVEQLYEDRHRASLDHRLCLHGRA